jgi:hypothetical protein
MGKQYQTPDAEASTPELAIPAEVSVALAEIAHSATEGLLALAVGAGLQVLSTLMEESVTALADPKGKHNPDRTAVRHGHEQGSVTLGGRRVGVQRPRVRAADGSGELPVAAYELFSGTEVLGRLALERMLHGLSTRRYPVGLEPVGTAVEQAASGTSKSASTPARSPWASPSMAPSIPWRWWKARPRTPPWPGTCSLGCASAAWTPVGRSWWSPTAPKRYAARSWTSSTTR